MKNFHFHRKELMIKGDHYIFNDRFLLSNKKAERLYHDYAEKMPIIDYHNHLPVREIAEDHQFKTLTEIWLKGDHYKWRALRALGVEEQYITGSASDEEKFLKWAENVPETLRNPLFHWTHLELKNPFGVETYLNKENAEAVYTHCNTLLARADFSTQNLLKKFKVKVVCTTDDPIDSLAFHQKVQQQGLAMKILPGFRPDNAFNIREGKSFRQYIEQLSEVSHTSIHNLWDLIQAFEKRIQYFKEHGGSLADHGLAYLPIFEVDYEKSNAIFKKALHSDETISQDEEDQYIGFLLYELCKIYFENNWVQQFHLGPFRNVNTQKLKKLGPDTGFDSIGDYRQGPGLAHFLNKLEESEKLGKTILYNINATDNDLFATMAGNFNEGPIKGKIQYGAAWWFHDQLDGMEQQVNTLSNMGTLSNFVGMLTDSRSFLSFSRHEYFRRLLCDIFGRDIEAGLLPNDEKWIGKIIENICYTNARNYFGWKD